MTLPPDNDDVCQICKEMVKEARDQLLSNETQDELKQVLDGSCALIPLKIISTECTKLMDNFLPELVDALASRMDPQLVCAVSGLCNSARIDKLIDDSQLTCASCKYHMSALFHHLNQSDNLKNALLEECGHLGSYSDSCRAAVLEEDLTLVRGYLDGKSGEFCELVGICGEGSDPVDTGEVAVYQPTEDLSCDFCKQLVNHVRTWLVDNATREEFDLVMKNLCKAVGPKHEKECVAFVKDYGDEIYQLVVDDLDADSFCQRVGVCPSESGAKDSSLVWTIFPVKSDTRLVKLVPPQRLIGTDERAESDTKCELCSYFMAQLQTYLDDPTTEHSIEQFVDQACTRYLPKEMASQCQEFVTEYGDELIELIGSEVDPKEICPRLKLCPVPKVTGVKDILPTCALCEFTVTKLINLIGKNMTKESIESATAKVCHALPKKYTDECMSFMKNYGDQVIEMILIEGSSHEICAALHLCLFSKVSPPAEPRPAIVTNNKGDDPKCVLCEYVITTLAARIKDNATEQEIKAELEQICTHLPKTVTKKCTTFVETYGDLILSYLVQEMDPQQVCQELRLCKAPGLVGVTGDLLELSQCQLCQVVEDYFTMKVDQKDETFMRNEIDETVSRLCGNLRNLKENCTELVEDYGPYLLQVVKGDTDPDSEPDGCYKVGLC